MNYAENPNEITRESLVSILDIMHRLAAPGAMPELLREIIEVGKLAIVAETGVLWLLDRTCNELVRVVPPSDVAPRLHIGEGWAGKCATDLAMSNIRDCREDQLFIDYPVQIPGGETRSLLNVPILGLDKSLLGVMQWLGAAVGQFDAHDEWVGPALAAQAAVAIQHSYMSDELLAKAILDQEVAVARDIQMSTLPVAGGCNGTRFRAGIVSDADAGHAAGIISTGSQPRSGVHTHQQPAIRGFAR
jgi:GAF domain-containing protein